MDDLLRDEARYRLEARITAAEDRRLRESPLADLPPAATASSRLELTGPTEALLELLSETMAELGLAWCSACEAWRPFASHEIGDTGDWGTSCRECHGTVDEQIEPHETEAVWQAIPVLRQLVKRVEGERLTLARGLLAVVAGTECMDPATWEVAGPYRWDVLDPSGPVCWEIKSRDPKTGLVGLVRVLRPMDAEHTREDGERLIAAARAGVELAKRLLDAPTAVGRAEMEAKPLAPSP